LIVHENETLGFRIAYICVGNVGLCKQSSKEYIVTQYSTLSTLIQKARDYKAYD